ncbi:probable 2-oxoglutarate-dependent dioxygenase AOP1.2 [Ziziphus jujuba]|uniref:Probable 2-oxoglutarate-dependent dioxygenase AOP1.2 n=1 Tax=Ziziphus jujuba TaxID=326968 RepID=A0ABM3I8R5_ZIZJJ|nr:probable 2-oxoglutarate-dependent dioxygenase AOP1.2 [Ziziphus jujuba]
MGSEIPCCKLPLIDFSKPGLNPGTPEWDSARDQVKQALAQYGCFEAFFDKVPPETRKAILDATEELYDLPSEIKRKNIYETPFPGYFGNHILTPLFESMAILDAVKLSDIESFINVYYPEGNSSLWLCSLYYASLAFCFLSFIFPSASKMLPLLSLVRNTSFLTLS